jgi:transglutaminase-like putative cysteine protease
MPSPTAIWEHFFEADSICRTPEVVTVSSSVRGTKKEGTMSIDRRALLKKSVVLCAAAGLPRAAGAQVRFDPQPGRLRSFQVVTRVEILAAAGVSKAWIPVPAVNEPDWFRSSGNDWTSNGRALLVRDSKDPKYGAEMIHVEWANGEKKPFLEVTSRIATRDRLIDLEKPGPSAALSAQEHSINTRGTELIPVGGIVKQTSDNIVANANAKTDLEKARAIYEWVVENTFREANVRGCGIGDIAAMLSSGHLGGKCADLNALYVGLVRAAGVPARDVYGIRVAPSKFGYKSLGTPSDMITKAQHCRSEVYLAGFGWVPVDAADVRKVMLEEAPEGLAINDQKVVAARKALFGSWEDNWLAYNFAHDIELPGSSGPRLPFLMYPQAETASTRLDCLDFASLKYTITARELTSA